MITYSDIELFGAFIYWSIYLIIILIIYNWDYIKKELGIKMIITKRKTKGTVKVVKVKKLKYIKK